MSRRRSSTSVSLPIPAPENIATREYYRSSETNDAHDNDIDYPKSRTPSPEKHDNDSNESSGVRSTEIYDFVEVRKDAPTSPSPSEIVLKSDLRDTTQLSELEQRTRDLPRPQRKTLLLKLQDDLQVERAKKAEEDDKEAGQEYNEAQLKGRDDV